MTAIASSLSLPLLGARIRQVPIATTFVFQALAIFALIATTARAHLLIPLSHSHQPPLAGRSLHRRANATTGLETMANWDMYSSYGFNVSVGTPPQAVSMTLSLATWDTWVPDVSLLCANSDRSRTNCFDAAFDPDASSTFSTYSSSSFSQNYVDGSSASGSCGQDAFSIAGLTVNDFVFGVARYAEATTKGVLALGYPFLNSISTAEIFLSWISGEGIISTPAFSIWADDPRGMTANLLFGAVDTAKFEGELVSISMSRYYSASIDSINATNSRTQAHDLISSESSSPSLSASVSPSDTLSRLPHPIASSMWDIANATFDEETGYVRIPCSAAEDSTVAFSFRFSSHWGPVVDVPLGDLVLSREQYAPATEAWGAEWCLFAVLNETRTSLYSLGKPVWTRTYLVFDTFNSHLGMAPTKFNVADSNIVPFDALGAEIPQSTMACISSEWACTGQASGYASRRGGAAVPLIIGITIAAAVCLALCTGIAGSIYCCKRQGLCCFRRHRQAREALARHTAAANMSPWPGGYAPGMPPMPMPMPMMEKYAGGPAPDQQPLMAEKYAGGPPPAVSPWQKSVPPSPQPTARNGLANPDAAPPASPMSAISVPDTPSPAVPLPPVPAPSRENPSGSTRPDKGKGKAAEEDQWMGFD